VQTVCANCLLVVGLCQGFPTGGKFY